MKKDEYKINYEHYSSLGDLPAADGELVAAAKDARATAYAPSTGFRVGAAARLASGRIVTSSNQESVVGPVGICAESGLLYNLQANHADDPVEALAIASMPDTAECYPCGMCRQILADTEQRQAGRPIRVIMTGRDSATVVRSSLDLLPFVFRM